VRDQERCLSADCSAVRVAWLFFGERRFMRGILAPLSPNEEITLRRVALGFGARDRLVPQHVRRLQQLALIEEADGVLRLTELGLQRYASLERPAKWAGDTDSQEISRLLTKQAKPDGSQV
jgi:hypothetical protein